MKKINPPKLKRTYRKKKTNKALNTPLKIILGLVVAVLISALVLNSIYRNALNQKTPSGEIIVNIQKGESIDQIVDEFNANGMMKPGWIYKLQFKYSARIERRFIAAGSFNIPPSISHYELIERMLTGEFSSQRKITFPEGLTYEEIADIAAKKGGINKAEFLWLCTSDSVLKAHNINSKNVEGYLLPETYFFKFDAKAKDVFNRLIFAADDFWTPELEAKAKAINMSRKQVLILASIIEAETPSAKEYRRVSGVYFNRLRIGMPLQADPTVQYGLHTKRKLTGADLKTPTLFNTYLNRGLTPTPINNPGKGAILAALEPEHHNFLYFVAVGGNRLEHNFAATFAEHKRNIEKYKRNKK
jgi:UPF0755 protein